MKVLILFINLLLYNSKINANPTRIFPVDAIYRLPSEKCDISQSVKDNIGSYSETANKIIDYFIDGPFKGKTWDRYFNVHLYTRLIKNLKYSRFVHFFIQQLRKIRGYFRISICWN